MEKSHGKVDNSITEALWHIPDEKFTVELLLNTATEYDEQIQIDHYHKDICDERFWNKTKARKRTCTRKSKMI